MQCGKRFSNNKLELYMNISKALLKYACKWIFFDLWLFHMLSWKCERAWVLENHFPFERKIDPSSWSTAHRDEIWWKSMRSGRVITRLHTFDQLNVYHPSCVNTLRNNKTNSPNVIIYYMSGNPKSYMFRLYETAIRLQVSDV
jgi:hypothetical protein